MIDVAALRALVPKLMSRPMRDIFFRSMRLVHHPDPLGRKRPIKAQRFNTKDGARVLYLGDDQTTCLHEVQAFGMPASSVAIVPVQLQLNAVLDLHAVRSRLLVKTTDIELNFRRGSAAPPTDMQVLGEELSGSRVVDGLLYPSVARPGSTCLALFEAGVIALGSAVEVNDPANGLNDRLP